jgi:ureidoglycolate lyase
VTRVVLLEPLTPEAFAPFGDVVEPPRQGERTSLTTSLQGLDGAGQPRLSFNNAPPWTLPLTATDMERHNRSSQCFVPIDVARWVVIVAPDKGGRPDAEALRAFLVRGDQAVNYHVGTWHHPLRPLDRPARFAVLMWTTGRKPDDEEWSRLPEHVSVCEGPSG